MTRVGVYLRISEDRDGSQTATERQREDCMRFAALRGWEVVDVFEDVDLSAFRRGVTRPEFERLLDSVRSKAIDGVLAWKVDRLSRRQKDLVRLDEAAEDAGGFLATVSEGLDTRQPTGRFVAELLVAQARMESENSSIRIKRKIADQYAQGLAHAGGHRPFGWTHGRREVIEDEAVLIREAAQRIIDGESLHAVCADWASRGVVTPNGGEWKRTPLRRLLMSPALSGQREDDGPVAWQPILTPEQTTRLGAILGDPARRTTRPARAYLLTGFAVCGRCGAALVGHAREGTRRYRCERKAFGDAACGRLARSAEPLEALVFEMVCIAMEGVNLREHADAEGDSEFAAISTAIREDEQALEELANDYYVGKVITRAEFFASRDRLVARLEEHRRRLAARPGRNVLAGMRDAGEEIARRWADESLEWRRSVIGAVIDRVRVLPDPRPGQRILDPALVEVVWRV